MFRKTIIAGLTAAAMGTGLAHAADAPAPPPEHTLTGNVGLYSQYIFRGLTQTDRDPALQGGFDYSHSSGFYLGTWGSNISWLRDFGTYSNGGSLEWDFYGGYKWGFAEDWTLDLGALYYWYPGDVVPGAAKANTFEIYSALSWKWLTGKISYALSNDVFGVTNADGTWYLDLSANVPIVDKLTLNLHYGIQEFSGSTPAGVSNDSFASYKDWKVGVSYSLPKDFTIGAFYSDTSMNATQRAFYTTPASAGSRFVGDSTFTVFVSKTF